MRKKRTLNRKRRTARYLLTLAVVVVLSSLTGFYTFTPGRAARDKADEEGIENARVVGRVWGEEELIPGWGRLLYLVEGERAMLLCPVNFSLFGGGWNGGIWCVVETWDGQDLYGGILQSQGSDVSYVFGRVDDPAIQDVVVIQTFPEYMARMGNMQTVSESAYFEKDGKRYFLERFSYGTHWEKQPEYYHLMGVCGEKIIVNRDIRCASWS